MSSASDSRGPRRFGCAAQIHALGRRHGGRSFRPRRALTSTPTVSGRNAAFFGVFGVEEAASFVAIGLHALQHRGQEGAGIVSYDAANREFHNRRALGRVRENFTEKSVMEPLVGRHAIGHTRYSTSGKKNSTEPRDVQPLYAELKEGGFAIAHNGNLTNARSLRSELVGRGAIFQSSSDTENILHLMAQSMQRTMRERFKDALRRVEGAYSIVAMTEKSMIGVRDPFGVRPLLLGKMGEAWVLASETCALNLVGADLVREVEPGEMIVIDERGVRTSQPFDRKPSRFCVFEYVYFARADSEITGDSVYLARQRIGEELAREAGVEADVVCPGAGGRRAGRARLCARRGACLSSTASCAALTSAAPSFEPKEEIRKLGARLKLTVNTAVVRGKRGVLVDDSIVRGTTLETIRDMIRDAGALEVHVRIASPPTRWPCFYGVDHADAEQAAGGADGAGGDGGAIGCGQPRLCEPGRALPRMRRRCGAQLGRAAILRRLL